MRRTLALLGAIGLDAAFDEPPNRWHPVAVMGRGLALGHERLRSSPRAVQLAGASTTVGAIALLAAFAGRKLERRLPAPLLALAVKPTFSLRQLLREGRGVASALEGNDLSTARARLGALVSRSTNKLDASLLAAAAIESLAENLSDSVVAPWFYYAGFGLAGAALYRVINTADAMFGYRGELEWLGKPAAKADDAINWAPSRLAALSLVLATTALDGPPAGQRSLACWRSDGCRTASPNAGRPMAAMAGALGRRLEKVGVYVLGQNFPLPDASDIRRAARLVEVAAGLAGMAAVAALVLKR
jgi:adenosylcobinamide-phosphate synthase